jgi:hypothetical protein
MNALISEVLGYLVDFAQYVQKLFGSAGLPKFNYGWLVALFFIFVIFLIGLSLGRSRILLSLICLYVAAFLEPHFIYFDKLRGVMKSRPESWLHLGLFLIFFIVSLVILNRSALKHSLTLWETSFFPIALIAILEIGFSASLIVSYFPSEIGGGLPVWTVKFFGTQNAQFWWALAPFALLLFMKHKKEVQKFSP